MPRSASASSSSVKGLVITASMPASRQAVRSALVAVAVSAMMGRRGRPRACSWRRISRVAARPSSTGMRQSISTRSGRSVVCRARSKACRPSGTDSQRTPRRCRKPSAINILVSSSSATSTSRGRSPGPGSGAGWGKGGSACPVAGRAAGKPGGGRATGRRTSTVKLAPWPAWLCTLMSPPIAMAISRAMVRPRPTPSVG